MILKKTLLVILAIIYIIVIKSHDKTKISNMFLSFSIFMEISATNLLIPTTLNIFL